MKKILIAIDNDFARNTYVEIFKIEKFNVLEAKDGEKALNLIKKEKPDVILIDIFLSKIGGFEILEQVKKENSLKDIPVVIFSRYVRKQNKEKAMKLEAKDFIGGASVSPNQVIRKIKIVLGEQKSYRIKISDETDNINIVKGLMCDLGYAPNMKCPKCGSKFVICLIRNLSVGKNNFILSFVCPKCE